MVYCYSASNEYNKIISYLFRVVEIHRICEATATPYIRKVPT